MLPKSMPRSSQVYKRRSLKRPNTSVWLSVVGLLLLMAGIRYFPVGSPGSEGTTHSGGTRYVVVFDAGSTGSRVHVYSFKASSSLQFKLLGDDFHLIKPGLSSYAKEPDKAAKSLKELLEHAVAAVPASHRASTPCILRATAGLRSLPGSQADDILHAVRGTLSASPFRVDNDSVSILSGQDEGAFAWLTLNYLLGNIGKPVEETVGTTDLGGGSVQMAYAVEEDQAQCGPKGYIKELNGGGKTYYVYVHSYMNFGLMASRAQILNTGEGSVCVAEGFSGEYSYGGKGYPVKASEGGVERGAECRGVVQSVLKAKTPCEAPKDQCSFQGAWGGPGMKREQKLFLISYFWDRAEDVGIIVQKKAIDAKLEMHKYEVASDQVCKMKPEEIRSKYPHVDESDAPYLCMDLSYCSALLEHGLGIGQGVIGNLVKQVVYGGKPVEMAWTLGAAIDSL